MALRSTTASELPKDKICLNRAGAVKFQLDLIEALCPPEKRVFIKNGAEMAGFCSTVTAALCYRAFHVSVRLGNQLKWRPVLPVIMLPAAFNLICQKRFVRNDIIVQKWTCPFCYHLRAAAYQAFNGVVYPVIASAFITFKHGRRLKTLDIPPINSKAIIDFYLKTTKPHNRIFGIMFCCQIFLGASLASLIAYENNDFNANIDNYISQFNNMLEN